MKLRIAINKKSKNIFYSKQQNKNGWSNEKNEDI
jgi:hypothetical protein